MGNFCGQSKEQKPLKEQKPKSSEKPKEAKYLKRRNSSSSSSSSLDEQDSKLTEKQLSNTHSDENKQELQNSSDDDKEYHKVYKIESFQQLNDINPSQVIGSNDPERYKFDYLLDSKTINHRELCSYLLHHFAGPFTNPDHNQPKPIQSLHLSLQQKLVLPTIALKYLTALAQLKGVQSLKLSMKLQLLNTPRSLAVWEGLRKLPNIKFLALNLLEDSVHPENMCAVLKDFS